MTELHVSADYLRYLAFYQNAAAGEVGWATAMVGGLNADVVRTHGRICAVTVEDLGGALATRSTAGEQVEARSSDLANKLDHAADEYDKIDTEYRARVDDQMRPGG
ncbi:ESX-1 secretion-associated protein [Mycolicibacterium baixiangningiae]|uniref:ESX-1 secretion-associated protein n=1 Tax=Mycolicibacterium baixiangningiae TaxID=2761578 RepID=UPI0018CFEED2|nr:ESX-1 secretion-associated protein [Mycolicibacterium baixiangningiae]